MSAGGAATSRALYKPPQFAFPVLPTAHGSRALKGWAVFSTDRSSTTDAGFRGDERLLQQGENF